MAWPSSRLDRQPAIHFQLDEFGSANVVDGLLARVIIVRTDDDYPEKT